MGNCDPYSDLPSLQSSSNHSLLGWRSRHCYAITMSNLSDFPTNPPNGSGVVDTPKSLLPG
jgi:hypothetical protein